MENAKKTYIFGNFSSCFSSRKIGAKNRCQKSSQKKRSSKSPRKIVFTTCTPTKKCNVCQKWCAHDCIRNQKCCDRKFGTVLKKSGTEQNSCYCPDPKPPPPTPVRPRGAARTGEGGRLVGNLIGPRCLCEIFAMS